MVGVSSRDLLFRYTLVAWSKPLLLRGMLLLSLLMPVVVFLVAALPMVELLFVFLVLFFIDVLKSPVVVVGVVIPSWLAQPPLRTLPVLLVLVTLEVLDFMGMPLFDLLVPITLLLLFLSLLSLTAAGKRRGNVLVYRSVSASFD